MIAHTLSPHLRKLLAMQGRVVARRPLPFLLVPLVLSVVLAYGFVFMEKVSAGQNALELYIPEQGLSKSGKDKIKEEFGDTYLSQLEPTNGVTFMVLLRRHDKGDILHDDFVTEYLLLRNVLESNQIHDPAGHRHTYFNLCWNDYRFGNNKCSPDFFKMLTESRGLAVFDRRPLTQIRAEFLRNELISSVERNRGDWRSNLQQKFLPFALQDDPDEAGKEPAIAMDCFLGTTHKHISPRVVTRIKYAPIAAIMSFHFPYLRKELAEFWELQFRKTLKHFRSNTIKLSWFTMRQFNRDLSSSAISLKELLPWLLLVIIVFCVASCCVADWVHSKPFLAVGGVFTAILSIMSGFGLLLLFQVQLVDIVFVAPFLVLSIGVDDMFLMLAAWRKTNCRLPVEERMSMTFADAAVSITITSLTDILSFLIGAFSVFPAVKYFCVYAAVCLLFGYIYQISIFGACMVYSGRREAQNRHCFIMKILPTSAEPSTTSSSSGASSSRSTKSLWYKVFCTGGDGKLDEPCDCVSSISGTLPPGQSSASISCEISPKDNMFNLFFQRYYAPLLRLRITTYIAGATYIGYLFVAIYGATTVNVGMNYAELLPDNAESTQYFKDYGLYFANSIAPPLEILLPGVDVTNELIQQEAIALAKRLEHSKFTGKAEFWLIDFLTYASTKRTQPDFHVWSGQSDFYQILADFLVEPNFLHYAPHLRFERPGELRSSRFFLDVTGVPFGHEKDFLEVVKKGITHKLRQACPGELASLLRAREEISDGRAMATERQALRSHSPAIRNFLPGSDERSELFSFQLAEQQAAVLPATLQTVGAATVAMLVISFLFIPKFACCLCLAACIISTNLGVVGCMALWGVRLDIVSMITVLMSIGISVDFVAHVSYFYVQAMEFDLPVSKAQRALSYLGLPILQGATSTICGMLVLLAINAYMIRAFVKTLLLVIIFGLYHGLLILPIALSLFIRDSPKKSADTSSSVGRTNNNLMIGTMSERSFAKHKPECGTMSTALPESLSEASDATVSGSPGGAEPPTRPPRRTSKVSRMPDPLSTTQEIVDNNRNSQQLQYLNSLQPKPPLQPKPMWAVPLKNTLVSAARGNKRKPPVPAKKCSVPARGNSVHDVWTTVSQAAQRQPQQNCVESHPAQAAWLKTPPIRYSEMTRTTRVLNWLLQTPPEGQYPAYSASSLDQGSVNDSLRS